jgi:hypothetical protein
MKGGESLPEVKAVRTSACIFFVSLGCRENLWIHNISSIIDYLKRGNADLIRGQFHRVILIPLPPVIQSHFVLNEFVKLHLILLIPMWLPLRHEQIHVINGTCFKNTEFLDQSRIERGFPGLQV